MLGIGAALGIVGSLGKMAVGGIQAVKAGKIKPVYTPYKESPYARQRLGMAQSLMNGRLAGAGAMERNIAANQASAMGNAQRGATDSSQLLALGAGLQAQSNDAYGDLAIKEQQNQYNLLDNLNRGYDGMTNELDKVYQDKLNKYQMDVNAKQQLNASGYGNIFSGLNDMASLATMMENKKNGGGMSQSMFSR